MPRISRVQPVAISNFPPLTVSEIERTGRVAGRVAFQAGQAGFNAFQAVLEDQETKLIARNELEFRSRISDLRKQAILEPDSDTMVLTFDQGSQGITDEILSRTPPHLHDQMANQMNRTAEAGRLAIFERALRRRRGESIQQILSGNDQALRDMAETVDREEFFEILADREREMTSFVSSGSIGADDAERLRRDLVHSSARNEALRLIQADPGNARDLIGRDGWINSNIDERDRLLLEIPLREAEARHEAKKSTAIAMPLWRRLSRGEVLDRSILDSLGPASIGGDGSLRDSDYLSLILRNESNARTNATDRVALAELNRVLFGERGPLEDLPHNRDAVDASWNSLLKDPNFSFNDLDVLDRAQMVSEYTSTSGIEPRTYIAQLKADLMSGRNPIARADAAIILDRVETDNLGSIELSPIERAKVDRIASNIEGGMSEEVAVEQAESAIAAMQGRNPEDIEAEAVAAFKQVTGTRYNTPAEYARDTSLWKQSANQVGSFPIPFTGIAKSVLAEFDVTKMGERGVRVEFFAERLAEISQLGTEMRDGFLRGWYEIRDDDFTGKDPIFPLVLAARTYQAISEGEPATVPAALDALINERAVFAYGANGGDAQAAIQTAIKEALSPNMFGWSTSRATVGTGEVQWVRYAPEMHYDASLRHAKGAQLIRAQAAGEAAERLDLEDLSRLEMQQFEDSLLIVWNPADGFRQIKGKRMPVYYLMRKGNPLSDNPDELSPTAITDQFGRRAPWFPDPSLMPAAIEEKKDLARREDEVRIIAGMERVLYEDALKNEGFSSLAPLGPVYIPKADPVDPAILTEEAEAQQEVLRGLQSPLWTRYLDRVLGDDRPGDMAEIEAELQSRERGITTERELSQKTAAARAFVKRLREAREESERRGF
jgi:hypothetical protein